MNAVPCTPLNYLLEQAYDGSNGLASQQAMLPCVLDTHSLLDTLRDAEACRIVKCNSLRCGQTRELSSSTGLAAWQLGVITSLTAQETMLQNFSQQTA